MATGGTRLLLFLVAAALAAGAGVLLLALGLPLLVGRAIDGERLGLLAALVALLVLGLGTLLLNRLVARPLDRLLAAASRLGAGDAGRLPPLGE